MVTYSSPPGGAIEKAEVNAPVSVNVARRIKEGRVGYGCSSSSHRAAMTMLNRETGRPSESPPASFCRRLDHTLAPPTRVSTVAPQYCSPANDDDPRHVLSFQLQASLYISTGFTPAESIDDSGRVVTGGPAFVTSSCVGSTTEHHMTWKRPAYVTRCCV
ncbi:hypothetical protein CSAL01_10582 [Colletotrichum salicis]|uniref:Uncharacterized protein n=1 Tax=Colletotrichum salicis TaxID=1209931 RepID=A0A135S850_9PEZI|nr:hypothetical protein CSAL01_10582 [Colletotrichum salicis]